jgi:hypothetical protein
MMMMILLGMEREAVVAYIKILSRNLQRANEKNHGNKTAFRQLVFSLKSNQVPLKWMATSVPLGRTSSVILAESTEECHQLNKQLLEL